MSLSPSLAGRAILAVGLMLGFYVLAIAIAAGLLYLPYAEWRYARRLHIKLTFFCILGAGTILWSILPRPERFISPGPLLEPKEHPKFFESLAEIAKATRQEMPSKVYLTPEVNAWVMDRSGMLGLQSQRIMGLGLPLLQVLSISQLSAVLAHEFGHFHGGDTRLGPWIYKTRAAIGRTIQGLAAHGSLLEKPFLCYGKAFLRITHAVSRRQEFAADALAARTVGPLPLIEGLKLVHSAALAFNRYWGDEIVPVLSQGLHPPLVEGFRHYMASSRVTNAVAANLAHELVEGETDPYDTHPPLRERIAAVQNYSDPAVPGDDLPAISLLGKIDGLETQLLRPPSQESTAQALQAVAWDEVGGKVWAPTWEALLGRYTTALAGNTPRMLPELSQNLEAFSSRLRECDGADFTSEDRHQHACAMLGIALATALSRNGWTLQVLPGEDAVCERKGAIIKPLDIVPALASGELTPEAWDALCISSGIADLDLGAGGHAGPDSTEDRQCNARPDIPT